MKISIEIETQNAALVLAFCKEKMPTLNLLPTAVNKKKTRLVAISDEALDFYKLGIFVAQTHQIEQKEQTI